MKQIIITCCIVFYIISANSQNYTSYFTGNTTDIVTSPTGGVCLMGGGTEHDEAMKWFLQKANGGDILVLRASGSDGYNDYLYTTLGVTVNSVETIVFNNATASTETYIHQKIANAEAIWFAGGDQWDYVSYWRNTAIDSLINLGIKNRNIVIGGTSAGMAILGGFYFSAQNGTVTSSTALSNPYDNNVTVDSLQFIDNIYLNDVITDTHYDNPDRKGRHLTFMARIFNDYGIVSKGIACDEYTAVCIDTTGLARVYGEYPSYDDNAYFIQPNCELQDMSPESCTAGNSLTWNRGGLAIKVYKVKGTNSGDNTFNLFDWETGSGGSWEDWYVENGIMTENPGNPINCGSVSVNNVITDNGISIFPNPAKEYISVLLDNNFISEFIIYDLKASVVFQSKIKGKSIKIDISCLESGMYFLKIIRPEKVISEKFIKE